MYQFRERPVDFQGVGGGGGRGMVFLVTNISALIFFSENKIQPLPPSNNIYPPYV